MKKLLAILSIATLLCSCAAEKRLARFLERHPELQRIDTVCIHDTLTLAADSNAIVISLSDIIAMDSIASAAMTEDTDSVTAGATAVNVSTDRSNAALQALGNGQYLLASTAPPDTIIRYHYVYVPHYITEYKEKPVEVYKQKWWQQGFMWIGVFALVIAIVWLLAFVLVKFAKPL